VRRRRLRVDPVAEPVLGDENIYRALGMRSLRRPENGRVEESLQGARERAHRGEGNCKSTYNIAPQEASHFIGSSGALYLYISFP
jgi:hypothetical protein